MDCGALLLGERGTSTRQIHLIVQWNMWESVRAKVMGEGGEICWSLLLGQMFLNLGSGNFRFQDKMSRYSNKVCRVI